MFIRTIICLSLLMLAACRYESTADLRGAAEAYDPSGAFPNGEYVFQTRDQNSMMLLMVEGSTARVAYQNQGGAPGKEQLIALLDSDGFPDKMFVAVALGGKSRDGVQSYHYYPFSFGKTHIRWFRPAEITTVFGLADLTQNMKSLDGGTIFSLVPPDQQNAVVARFEAWRAKTVAGQQAPRSAQQQAPPAPVMTEPTVNGLTVGDGVYVQGAFSDQPSIIQQIDTASGRVKVRRYSDGVSEWVPMNRIISRDQSTVNDVARTGIVIGAFVCMFSPETCKGTQK